MKLKNILESTAVISAYITNNDQTKNEKLFGSLIKDVRDANLTFTIQSGKWRSKKEPSLRIQGITFDKAKELMAKYKQETIIYNGEMVTKQELEE